MNRFGAAFAAVVLAGDRGPQDPVARAAGVDCKALAPVCGRPMLLRVLDALQNTGAIGSLSVSGAASRLLGRIPELDDLIAAGKIRWVESASEPSTSTRRVLDLLPNEQPVLLTTADHALITPQMVDYFCDHAASAGCDVVAGLVRAETVAAAFPENRRTVTRLHDAHYCSCNLFAFLNSRGRQAAAFWRRVEAQRKHPLKIAGVLGFSVVARYLLGCLTLEQALARLSERIGARAGAVWMPDAQAAVDVDTVEDWLLVEKILGRG